VWNQPFVLGVADPGGVDHEPTRLRVLDERVGEPRRGRVRLGHHRRQVVGDRDPEHAAEERPRRLTAVDHRLGRLRVRQPHEHVPGEHRGEDQRVHHPSTAGCRICDQAHPAEVDLDLTARVPVSDPYGRRRPAIAQLVHTEPMQRPVRHHHTAAGEQVVDLHHRQTLLDPLVDPVALRVAALPRLSAAAGPDRPDRLDHRAQQLVGQLPLTAGTDQSRLLGGLHIPADRLAVRCDELSDRAQPLPAQPQAQHLSDLGHRHLPERHAPSR
jgi:hypothetical protein